MSKKLEKIKVISFDGDGTLWDFEKLMRHSLNKVIMEFEKIDHKINVNEILPGLTNKTGEGGKEFGLYFDPAKTANYLIPLALLITSHKKGIGPTGQTFAWHRRPIF